MQLLAVLKRAMKAIAITLLRGCCGKYSTRKVQAEIMGGVGFKLGCLYFVTIKPVEERGGAKHSARNNGQGDCNIYPISLRYSTDTR
jgi:hypothetical protein